MTRSMAYLASGLIATDTPVLLPISPRHEQSLSTDRASERDLFSNGMAA